jgi:hypothetical protein
MAEPSNPDEAVNTEPVPQAARPVGSRPDSDWTAVSGTGDAEYGTPAAERGGSEHGGSERDFATSVDTPLESDINQRLVPPEPGGADDELGVRRSGPAEDLAEGPPDGR